MAIDMGNIEEVELRYQQFIEDEDTLRDLNSDNTKVRNARLKQTLGYEGRLSYLNKAYDEALKKYAQFLDVDLSSWGRQNADLVEIQNKSQEAARDYLYAGKCLLKLEKNQEAQNAMNVGLVQNPYNGNHYYQGQIRAEIPE